MTDTINKHIYKAFHDFIRVPLPSEVIRLLDGSFVAPSGSYTALKVSRIERLSPYTHYYEEPLVSDTNRRAMVATLYKANVLIRCFGTQSFAKAVLLSHAFSDPTCRVKLSDKHIGYARVSAIADDSVSLMDQTIEERATFTVEINLSLYEYEMGTTPTDIETISITSEFE